MELFSRTSPPIYAERRRELRDDRTRMIIASGKTEIPRSVLRVRSCRPMLAGLWTPAALPRIDRGARRHPTPCSAGDVHARRLHQW